MPDSVEPSYSDHALSRMYARGIFKKQVRRTLNRPDTTSYDKGFYLSEYQTSSGITVRIVYLLLPEAQEPHVVSVIRLGKLTNAVQHETIGLHPCPTLDLIYIALSGGELKTTRQVAPGIYCDLNREGEVMGVEVFNYRQYGCGTTKSPQALLRCLPGF